MTEPAVAWPAMLATPRLHARPIAAADRGFHAALTGDPDVMRHVGGILDAAAAGRVFETIVRATAATPARMHAWRLDEPVARSPGETTGIGLMTVVPRAGTSAGELGLLFAARQHARGYAGEVVADLLAAVAPAGRLFARHRPGNHAVERLMMRLEFRRDGHHDGYMWWTSA